MSGQVWMYTVGLCQWGKVFLLLLLFLDVVSAADRKPSGSKINDDRRLPSIERGFCLSGDYERTDQLPVLDIGYSRVNFSAGAGGWLRSSSAGNFESLNFRPLSELRFAVDTVYGNVYQAFLDYRGRSTYLRSRHGDSLRLRLDNIGVGSRSEWRQLRDDQSHFLEKLLSFYRIRAEAILGEFRLRPPSQLRLSTEFRAKIREIMTSATTVDDDGQTGNRTLWNDSFFLTFGTHYAYSGTLGGYVDLTVSPWDGPCRQEDDQSPPKLSSSIVVHDHHDHHDDNDDRSIPRNDLRSLADCTVDRLNAKFELNASRGGDDRSCQQFNYWSFNDKLSTVMVAGGDDDRRLALSIVVANLNAFNHVDTLVLDRWLQELPRYPGLINADLAPICDLFPAVCGELCRRTCLRDLHRFLDKSEPMSRTNLLNVTQRCFPGNSPIAFVGRDDDDDRGDGRRDGIDGDKRTLKTGCASNRDTGMVCFLFDQMQPQLAGYVSGSSSSSSASSLSTMTMMSLWSFLCVSLLRLSAFDYYSNLS